MTNKLKAIGKSFLLTALPTFPPIATFYIAGWCSDRWNELFFWTGLLSLIFVVFLGVVAILSAACFQNVLDMIKWNRLSNATAEWLQSKGEKKRSLVFVKVGEDYEIKEKVEKENSGKAGILFFAGILLSPVVLLFWVYQVFKILFSNNYSDFINSFYDERSKDIVKFVIVIILSVVMAFSSELMLVLQDAKYSVNNFDFKYVSFEYGGDDWGGNNLGQCSVYYLTYEFQNVGNIKGGLSGDIIAELKTGEKIKIISNDSLTPYYPSYERDFERYSRNCYWYLPLSNIQANNTLKNNLNEVKIYALVTYAGWEGGVIESQGRTYDNPVEIVIKDFGVGGQTQSPGQTGGDNSGTELSTEQKYQQAITYYNNGQYEQALEIFGNLGDYKQSSDYVLACEEKLFYVQMEKDLYSVAGNNAILPDNYLLNLSYSANEYTYYSGNYYLSFYANFYCHRLEMQEYLNNFITKLICSGYSYVNDGVYKKDNNIIKFEYFEGLDSFDYYAFKIS